jgi:TadE-like protein
MFLRFRRGTPSSRGQALVETALVLPILALILVMAVDFGRVFFGWVALQSAARVGAEYAGQWSCAWEGTCPENADKLDRYEELIQADMRAINCELAGGTVPDPTFRHRVGTETAGEFDDGDYAILELECSFDLITPIAEAMFGGRVETIAHEEFPIHATILQAVPSPPELPPPCPAGQAEVPDVFGEAQTVAIARNLWAAAGFVPANFNPTNGNNNRITNSQSLLKNECAVTATAVVTVTWP